MNSPEKKKQKSAQPEYELDTNQYMANPDLNHHLLYDIRKVVEVLHYNSPLRKLIDGSGTTQKAVETYTKEEQETLTQAKHDLYMA